MGEMQASIRSLSPTSSASSPPATPPPHSPDELFDEMLTNRLNKENTYPDVKSNSAHSSPISPSRRRSLSKPGSTKSRSRTRHSATEAYVRRTRAVRSPQPQTPTSAHEQPRPQISTPSSQRAPLVERSPGDVQMNEAEPSMPEESSVTIPIRLGWTDFQFKIPQVLQRPAPPSYNDAALKAVGGDLAQVPHRYVQRELHGPAKLGLKLCRDQQHTRIVVPPTNSRTLPKELHLVMNDLNIVPPTHALAVYKRQQPGSSSDPRGPKFALFPIHALILAAHCSHLPTLPPSRADIVDIEKDKSGKYGRLPVPSVAISVPDPLSWPALMNWLYTGDSRTMMKFLCPFDYSIFEQTGTIEQIARKLLLELTSNTELLTRFTFRVHGVWANACCVGVWDEQLWRTIEHTWAVIYAACGLVKEHSSTAIASSDS
ncbi:hypothetical protein SISNIDRAFT_450773, partial [Sistotremastrum niveocremeum HHB9708]